MDEQLEKSAFIIHLIPLSLACIHLQTVGTIQRKVNSTYRSYTNKIKVNKIRYEPILAVWHDDDDDNAIWEVILPSVYMDSQMHLVITRNESSYLWYSIESRTEGTVSLRIRAGCWFKWD